MKWIKGILLLLCLLSLKGWSQPGYRATVPPVEEDAFYGIDLPYTVLGGASRDLADIRIWDNKGKEVAWFLREDIESKNSNEFITLPAKITLLPRKTEVLITADAKPYSSFLLKIKNADVDKEGVLLGSNNGTKWFAVKDNFQLNKVSSPDQTESLIGLSFPLSDYKFYKLSLNDFLSAPLNIVGVGWNKAESYNKQNMLKVPLTASRIKTEGKKTTIELVLPFKFDVERLDFYISSPKYFRRSLALSTSLGEAPTAILSDAGGCPQSVSMSSYDDTLRLSVYNGDDRALTIDSIKAYVRKYSVIAELKKGVAYTLTYGDSKAKYPQYDLSFSNRVPKNISHVVIGGVERIPAVDIAASSQEKPSAWLIFLKTYGLWIIIVVVIVQILWMVRKMLK